MRMSRRTVLILSRHTHPIHRPQIVAFIQPVQRATDHGGTPNDFADTRLISFIAQLKTLSALCILASIVSSEDERVAIGRLVSQRRRDARVRAEGEHRSSSRMSVEATEASEMSGPGRDASTHVLRRAVVAETMDARRRALEERMEEEGIEGFAKVFWVCQCARRGK